ncbi:hypothetical protein [Candidatus Berkiella aquae]|uniref:Ankyrin repeats (3 copies) n=1 Tax=Candidatus Berkiella aquae TaxID=295108 RepID=A0A0Q9YU92_9GAMM|nr:hypothetical protein [Candidatus Berkiella aquae]MCS5712207.1 hypothetical protein [Candidatus Berkiella aquae]
MIGAPITFSSKMFEHFECIYSLANKHFGGIKVVSGATIRETITRLQQELPWIMKFRAEDIEQMATLSDVTQGFSQLSLKGASKKDTVKLKQMAANIGLTPTNSGKKDFYEALHNRFMACFILSSHVFKTLYDHQEDLQKTKEQEQIFHEAIRHFLLLGCITGLNIAVYLTHPAHEKCDPKKISTVLNTINNWNTLLETYHLHIAKENSFEEMRLLFIQHFLAFQDMTIQKGIFLPMFSKPLDSIIDFMNQPQTEQFVIPAQMRLPFSTKELLFHVKRKNDRAIQLGTASNIEVMLPLKDSLHCPSKDSLKLLADKLQTIYKNQQTKGSQILFYYGSPYGNVDLFNVHYDATRSKLIVVNIHPERCGAQHDLLSNLEYLLRSRRIPLHIFACQADFGSLQQHAAVYALRLCSLIAQVPVARLEREAIPCPAFIDTVHKSEQRLGIIVNVSWFPINILGDKAILLKSTLPELRTLLGKRFANYQTQYDLTEATQDMPDMLSTYADYCRKWLGLTYFCNQPFRGITIENIAQKLASTSDGQTIRRAAAGYCSLREFEFVINHFKSTQNEALLHKPAKEKDYTPLHWALKEKQGKRAALLLNATTFAADELNEKNMYNMSAYDYFANAADDSTLKNNAVLQRCLKR